MTCRLIHGDCVEMMAALEADSIDAIVTDPPYELGFMGKGWDASGVAFQVSTWAAALRVLKPGGHLIAMCGTRTEHRVACAIEDAGFEIRDRVLWLYGKGFPKSLNVSKAIDARQGRWDGWGTALKPAMEIAVLARKPLSEGTVAANVLRWGTGALNIDGCRIGSGETRRSSTGGLSGKANPILGTFSGPAAETIETTLGRWPANVTHDGSDEVVGLFPVSESGARKVGVRKGMGFNGAGGDGGPAIEASEGSAARFFYSAKASTEDRAGSKHPTVKPVALMRWLCRLITPPGGTVLDPFAGSGTTGQAALEEGFNAVLIEREAEYAADIQRRLDLMSAGPATREAARIKAAGHERAPGSLPLFGGGGGQ